jgi:hypothetical protein
MRHTFTEDAMAMSATHLPRTGRTRFLLVPAFWDAVAALGVVIVLVGLTVDALVHEIAPAEETLLSFSNPGHPIAGFGLALTGISVLLALTVSRLGETSLSRDVAFRLAVVGAAWVFVIGSAASAVTYLAATGASVGHSHGDEAAAHGHGAGVSAAAGDAADHHRDIGPHPTFVQFQTQSADSLASMAPAASLSAAEAAELRTELLATHAAVSGLETVEKAEAAGYEVVTVDAIGMGAHYVNMDYLLDSVFDPMRPEGLLFSRVDSGAPRLVGVWFLQFPGSAGATETVPPAGFTSDLDVWHGHDGVCYVGLEAVSESVTEEACNEHGGLYIGDQRWMLHAWVTPGGGENPDGVFAYLNAELSSRQVEAVPVGVQEFVIPEDGATSDAESSAGNLADLRELVLNLPEGALRGAGEHAGERAALLALIDGAIAQPDHAMAVVAEVRVRLTGCAPTGASSTWMTDCSQQIRARALIDAVAATMASTPAG